MKHYELHQTDILHSEMCRHVYHVAIDTGCKSLTFLRQLIIKNKYTASCAALFVSAHFCHSVS